MRCFFLLLFVEVVFFGFGWLFLILGGCVRVSHTPVPSREGRLECFFLVGNEWFVVWWVSPLERGDWDDSFLFENE